MSEYNEELLVLDLTTLHTRLNEMMAEDKGLYADGTIKGIGQLQRKLEDRVSPDEMVSLALSVASVNSLLDYIEEVTK